MLLPPKLRGAMRKWFARNFPNMDGAKLMMLPILLLLVIAMAAAVLQPIIEPGTAFSDQLWVE